MRAHNRRYSLKELSFSEAAGLVVVVVGLADVDGVGFDVVADVDCAAAAAETCHLGY